MTVAVTVEGVTKVYSRGLRRRRVTALNNVSLSVNAGEVFGLLGPNGAGKTTLVKAALGLVKVDAGHITLGGETPSNPLSRLRVGYLAEDHRFPRALTPLELLTLSARLSGKPERSIRARREELLRQVVMWDQADIRIARLSKGMAQRIGIAQAIIHDPEIIFLDEPTDGVDPLGRTLIRQLIIELRNQGKTVIVNSHLLAEFELFCDRVAILDHGVVLTVGRVTDLTRSEREYDVSGTFTTITDNLPAEIGRIISRTDTGLVVEIHSEPQVDILTDWLRQRNAHIHSLTPRTRTLESVYIQLLRASEGPATGREPE